MGDFFCVMLAGNAFITDDIRDELLASGYLMVRAGQKRRKIKCKVCEGVVTSNLKSTVLDAIAGIGFLAELEIEEGKIKVNYIVRGSRLRELEEAEEGAWIGIDDLGTELSPERIRPNPIKRLGGNCN